MELEEIKERIKELSLSISTQVEEKRELEEKLKVLAEENFRAMAVPYIGKYWKFVDEDEDEIRANIFAPYDYDSYRSELGRVKSRTVFIVSPKIENGYSHIHYTESTDISLQDAHKWVEITEEAYQNYLDKLNSFYFDNTIDSV